MGQRPCRRGGPCAVGGDEGHEGVSRAGLVHWRDAEGRLLNRN